MRMQAQYFFPAGSACPMQVEEQWPDTGHWHATMAESYYSKSSKYVLPKVLQYMCTTIFTPQV